MNKKLIGAYLYSQSKFQQWKEKTVERVKEVFADETGDVNVVAIVVLIGVAVLLAVVFKDQIAGLLETLFGTISGNATNAVNTAPGSNPP